MQQFTLLRVYDPIRSEAVTQWFILKLAVIRVFPIGWNQYAIVSLSPSTGPWRGKAISGISKGIQTSTVGRIPTSFEIGCRSEGAPLKTTMSPEHPEIKTEIYSKNINTLVELFNAIPLFKSITRIQDSVPIIAAIRTARQRQDGRTFFFTAPVR